MTVDPRIGPESQQSLTAGLYVIATPIGNLGDITLRALGVLKALDLLLAEDTRVTRKLLDAYGLRPPLLAYHDHNADQVRPRVLAALAAGQAVGLVSDAGTPLVSDPGYKLTRDAAAAGHRVIPVPGASAPLAALTAAGLPSDRFLFAGFPPAKAAARQAWLRALAATPATLILFETGPRLAASLADMAAAFGLRPAAVARELTKLYEEVRRDDLGALAAAYAAEPAPRGEIVVLVGPPAAAPPADEAAIDDALAALLPTMSLRAAVDAATQALGAPRKTVYARALKLQGGA